MLIGSDLKGNIHTYHIYPLVIISDRYSGTYSKGEFTVWNCYPEQVPDEVFDSDIECLDFWIHAENDPDIPKFGVGNSIQDAIDDLYKKLPDNKRMVQVEPNHWIRADFFDAEKEEIICSDSI